MCTAAFKKGWRSTVLNYRGCNGVPHTSDKGYNAMDTEDTQLAISHIKRYERAVHDGRLSSEIP